MKKTIILFILALFGFAGFTQESGKVIQTLKGKIINESTNESVAYTNIGLEGTFYGTASDAEGNFELKIPEELTSKNIFFSAVGFKNIMFPVTELFNKEFNVIKLSPQSYDIENIDIAAQSKVLIRILRMAAENTPYNFIGGPLNLICNYENQKTINGSTQTKQNANVVIYDKTGYSNPSISDAFQSVKYAVKKTQKEEEADYRFSTGTNNIDELLELDWVRSGASILNPALLPDFKLKLDSEPELNGNKYWIISFKQNAPTLAGSGDFYATFFEGKITIKKDDYSVLKIEGTVRSEKNSMQGKTLAVTSSSINVRENVAYNFTVTYSNLKPDEIILNKSYTCEDEKISEQSGLKINQVQTTNITALKSRDYFSGE